MSQSPSDSYQATHCRYAIFLPVRNGADYLRQAIDSVLNQSINDWLLIVLDNASSDGSAEIASSYDEPRIQVYKSERALTIFESWHRIWSLLDERLIQAEFMTIIGHDDVYKTNFLSDMDALQKSNPSAGLYQSAFNLIDKEGRLIRPCKPIPSHETSADFLSSRAWGLRDSFGTGYVFRVADYLRMGGMPDLPNLIFSDDLLFARLAKHGGKVSSEEVACEYRLHRGSTSGALSATSMRAVIAGLFAYLQYLKLEFPAYWDSSRGRTATACLIAREALIFRSPCLRWALPDHLKNQLTTLVSLYEECSSGIKSDQWLGSNFLARKVYPAARKSLWFVALIREYFVRSV